MALKPWRRDREAVITLKTSWAEADMYGLPLQMVNKGGVAEMASLLLLIAQETEQKMTSKPEADGEAHADMERPSVAEGSSSGGGAPDKTHSSYSGAPRAMPGEVTFRGRDMLHLLWQLSAR